MRPWIDARAPDDPHHKRRFIVRRDPRDISVVYFYDPELEQHFEIPYRDHSRPAISVWELREVQRQLRTEGEQALDEERIFAAYERLRALEERAVKETKSARKSRQRRRWHQQADRPQRVSDDPPPASFDEPDDGPIEPFDEREELGERRG